MLLAGCGLVSSKSATSFTMGDDGGEMTHDNATLTVEKGALEDEVTFTVKEAEGAPEPEAGEAYEFWPADEELDASVHISIHVPLGGMPRADYEKLRLARYENGDWSLDDIDQNHADPEEETVSGKVWRLGIFGANFCHPDCVGKQCGLDGCGSYCGNGDEKSLGCEDAANCNPETFQCECEPDCAGKECGDDGCDGNCGDCSGPQDQCLDGQCVCQPDCQGKECGGDDGCDGTCPFTCGNYMVCTDDFKCQCAFTECDDGCCAGNDHVCSDGSCCLPDCQGKECGDNGCGGFCGSGAAELLGCQEGQKCNPDELVCECAPDCDDKECGNDGCEGTCGDCENGFLCDTDGQCSVCESGVTCSESTLCCPNATDVCYEDACCDKAANCLGQECGDDECGETCGTCLPGTECTDGACCLICDGTVCGDDMCGEICECDVDTTCVVSHGICAKSPDFGDIVVTEIMTNASAACADNVDWIEIWNVSGNNVNLKNCILSDNGSKPAGIGQDLLLEPDQRLVLVQSTGTPEIFDVGDVKAYPYGTTPNIHKTNADSLTLECFDVTVFSVKIGGEDEDIPMPKTNWQTKTRISMQLTEPPGDVPDIVEFATNPYNWCPAEEPMECGDTGTPGYQNPSCECVDCGAVGWECGHNGCGGECGTCAPGQECLEGMGICVRTPTPGELIGTELMTDASPACTNIKKDWVEVYNTTDDNLWLMGCELTDGDTVGIIEWKDVEDDEPLPVILKKGYLVLVQAPVPIPLFEPENAYFYGGNPNLNKNDAEYFSLSCNSEEVFTIDYGGANVPFPKDGDGNRVAVQLNNVGQVAPDYLDPDDPDNWCFAEQPMTCGDLGTPGQDNLPCQ